MKALDITSISKSFSNQNVLDDISLAVKENEIFGFIGLNGQGKTTLIKIILDLLDQDSGDISIYNISNILPKSRKKICYLPEKFQPSLNQTGKEFINFTLGFYNKKFIAKDAEKLCIDLDLPFKVLNEKIGKYSKGMIQKLGLIATFLSEADLIILDEPMSGLDPKARIKLKKELIAYNKLGKTIFFSSHILSDMDEICSTIAILNDAKIVYQGSPKSFKEKHQENILDNAFLKEIGIF